MSLSFWFENLHGGALRLSYVMPPLRSRRGSRQLLSSLMLMCAAFCISLLWAPTLVLGASFGSCSSSLPGCDVRPVPVGIIGFGLVGKELLAQIQAGAPQLKKLSGLDIAVVAVARSRAMFLGDKATASATAGENGIPTDLIQFGEFMGEQVGDKVIVDCTADDAPAELYSTWLAAGIHVVTPNKKLGSGPLARHRNTFEAGRSGGARFLYEATVGAGLPIITTLQDLRRTGDTIHKIEGIFSGTLSYLFNEGAGKPFSAVVQDAADKGFTEPDPRDDLSGLDVQRKTVILARDCGIDCELSDVPVESLVPDELQQWEPSEAERSAGLAKVFIQKLKAYDDIMAKRMQKASASGNVLRYVGSVDIASGKASVGLMEFPRSHPFAATKWADNIVSFSTERYTPRPLVVQGPGAGAAVTAGGVFADLLRALG